MIQLKRVYDSPSKGDGFRVLVEGNWPGGVSKKKAKLDLWLREVAPSEKLRKWFGHDPEKWEEFRNRYWAELYQKKEALEPIRDLNKKGPVTLIYSAKDAEHNSAVALATFLDRLEGKF